MSRIAGFDTCDEPPTPATCSGLIRVNFHVGVGFHVGVRAFQDPLKVRVLGPQMFGVSITLLC